MTRTRSPKSITSASRSATAWVGTTTASACLRARFAIAFVHSVAPVPSVSGCVHASVSWMVTAICCMVVQLGVSAQRGQKRRRVQHPRRAADRDAGLPGQGELAAGRAAAA